MAFSQGFSCQILVPVPAQVKTDKSALSKHVCGSKRLQLVPCHTEYVKFWGKQVSGIMSVKSEQTDIFDVVIDS